MRRKDPEVKENIIEFAEDFYFKNRRSPSTSEIARGVGIGSKGTIHRYLVEMADEGMITYDGKDITTRKILQTSPFTKAEFFNGPIPCGTPDQIEASVDEYVNLPTAIFGKSNYYIIRTTGDSMINAGIESGDLVVVEKTTEAKNGEIVVALHDNASTLKRVEYDEEHGYAKLIPENDFMQPIYVDKLEIQGVARFIIKAL